jgi:hypothetical protein
MFRPVNRGKDGITIERQIIMDEIGQPLRRKISVEDETTIGEAK